MIHTVLTACLYLLLAAANVHAGERALLQNIVKNETLGQTVLGLAITARPEFRLKISGQRIDLLLSGTTVGASLGRLPQDGSILRILLAQKGPDLLVSFLLVRPPRGARVVSGGGKHELALHISWNSGTGKVRPAIATRLRGVSVINGSGTNVRVVVRSRYAQRWKFFYQEYRTPIGWDMPVRYTLPELPGPGSKQAPAGLFQQAWQHSLAGRWPETLALLRRLPAAEVLPADQQSYLLLHGAALIQGGDYESALELYRRFGNAYPASPDLNTFKVLLAVGRARAGDPYGAASEINDLARPGGEKGQSAREARAGLLLAEVYLATGRPGEALQMLTRITGGAGPARLSRTVLLRTADARAALGRYGQARAGYGEWLAQAGADSLDPYSLAHLALTLEQQGELAPAEKTYIRLAGRVRQPERRALALFAAARVALARGAAGRAAVRFAAIRKDYPGSEGAFRAWLKELDLMMVGDARSRVPDWSNAYKVIASTAPGLVLRGEAAFKYALALVLDGKEQQGIGLLQRFRRDFAGSSLRREAELLTLEKLEPLVTELVGAGRALDALVLVEQNRDLLATYVQTPDFVLAVAEAFLDLGLPGRADRVCGYMLAIAEGTAAEERFYLPLVESLFAAGRYQEVSTAVRRYRKRFPAGQFLLRLRLFQGRALLALGRLDEAATLLPELQGEAPEISILSDQLHLALAVRNGADSGPLGDLLAAAAPGDRPGTRLLRAEQLLRQGRPGPALAIFRQLIALDGLADQARYRSAQILLNQGEHQRGINFLQELADKGRDPCWRNLAREMLAMAGAR
ncbi:MAG: tetratricopeptide repeat protein [Desulfobacterales bacterium]|nr:tetratricopeptide repeat protein [Desulfobacterales bacterium]